MYTERRRDNRSTAGPRRCRAIAVREKSLLRNSLGSLGSRCLARGCRYSKLFSLSTTTRTDGDDDDGDGDGDGGGGGGGDGGGYDGRYCCFLVPPLDSAALVLSIRPPTAFSLRISHQLPSTAFCRTHALSRIHETTNAPTRTSPGYAGELCLTNNEAKGESVPTSSHILLRLFSPLSAPRRGVTFPSLGPVAPRDTRAGNSERKITTSTLDSRTRSPTFSSTPHRSRDQPLFLSPSEQEAANASAFRRQTHRRNAALGKTRRVTGERERAK